MVAPRRFLAMVWLMLIGLGVTANAADVAIPRSPARWATDTSGFLRPQTVASLDARLHAYQTKTGHQILVYVAPTTGDAPMEDWTARTFRRWKVGRKGLDDGLVLFVFPTDHKVRIEVGYGLEQTVPDATASRIIRESITPKLRAGQRMQRSSQASIASSPRSAERRRVGRLRLRRTHRAPPGTGRWSGSASS
jgi:uncharacterized protein